MSSRARCGGHRRAVRQRAHRVLFFAGRRWRCSCSWRGRRRSSWRRPFPEFPAYAARVPRFWPRLSPWQEADELIVKPRLVHRTFLDASLFLLAVPAVDSGRGCSRLASLPVLFTCRDGRRGLDGGARAIGGLYHAASVLPPGGAPVCPPRACRLPRSWRLPLSLPAAARRRWPTAASPSSQAPRLDPARRLPARRAQAHGGAADLRRPLDLADRERRRRPGSPPTTTTTCGPRWCPTSPP